MKNNIIIIRIDIIKEKKIKGEKPNHIQKVKVETETNIQVILYYPN